MHELHDAHAQQGTHGVEDGEHGPLIGVVGEHGLARSGAGGLESVPDNPHEVDHRKGDIPQGHHALGDEGSEDVQADDAHRHDRATQDHKGTEFADLRVGAVHHRADDGIGDGIADPHSSNHQRREDPQMQDIITELGHIGQNQDEIDVCGTVVQRKQHQLIRLCTVQSGVRGLAH